MKRAFLSVCILASVFSLSGCGGENSKFDLTRPIESSLDIALDGLFTGPDDMTVEFDEDEGVLIDYGDSIYGTNPVVIALGSPLIQDIRCDTVSCDGLYGVPQVSNGVVDSVRWESVTLTPTEDGGIAIESASLGELVFEPKKEPEEQNEDNLTSTKNLTYDASCEEWWDALSNNGNERVWRAFWMRDYSVFSRGLGGFPENFELDLEFKFSGEDNYEFTWIFDNSEFGIEHETGQIPQGGRGRFGELGGVGHCRFVAGSAVLFPHQLVDGELTLIDINNYEEMIKFSSN